jgi:hypothetical protein
VKGYAWALLNAGNIELPEIGAEQINRLKNIVKREVRAAHKIGRKMRDSATRTGMKGGRK